MSAYPARIAFASGLLITGASILTNISSAIQKMPDLSSQIIAGSIAAACAGLVSISLASAVKSLKARDFGTATIAALIFSLTATFSVTSALGVIGAPRIGAADIQAAQKDERKRIVEARERALAELGTISASTRSAAELNSAMLNILAQPGVNGCVVIDGPQTRKFCGILASLKSEQEAYTRRSALNGTITRLDAELASMAAPKVANGDAVSIVALAAVFGVKVEVATVNAALMILAVLILELGGGVAFTLAQSLNTKVRPVNVSADVLKSVQVIDVSKPVQAPMFTGSRLSRETVKERTQRAIKESGTVPSIRTLSAITKAPVSSVHRALNDLRQDGLIAA
jgi:hypothetical protein